MTPPASEARLDMGEVRARLESKALALEALSERNRQRRLAKVASMGSRVGWSLQEKRYAEEAGDLRALLAENERMRGAAFEGDLQGAVALLPKGWWFSVCRCELTCDASIGPDIRHPDCDPAHIEPFDAGFHVDLLLPSTLGDALREAIKDANTAIAALAPTSTSREGESVG